MGAEVGRDWRVHPSSLIPLCAPDEDAGSRELFVVPAEFTGVTCPYLDYRDAADDRSFDGERAYCEVAARFVQPMRADICNDRYTFDHESHCEIYRDHVGEE